jgi:hypothetical protein
MVVLLQPIFVLDGRLSQNFEHQQEKDLLVGREANKPK